MIWRNIFFSERNSSFFQTVRNSSKFGIFKITHLKSLLELDNNTLWHSLSGLSTFWNGSRASGILSLDGKSSKSLNYFEFLQLFLDSCEFFQFSSTNWYFVDKSVLCRNPNVSFPEKSNRFGFWANFGRQNFRFCQF